MLQYLVLVGATVNLLGCISYIRQIIKGTTRPNKVSWLMWAIAPLIASAAGLSSGVGWAVLPVFMSGFCPLLIFIASLLNKHAYWQLTRFDYICGIFSALALILWGITKEPSIAIVFAILSDGAAAIPTIKKSWTNPESETAWPFVTGTFSALTSFVAIKVWSFDSYAFPTYLVIVCLLIIFAIERRRFLSPKTV